MAQGPKELIEKFELEVLSFETQIDNALANEKIFSGESLRIKTPAGLTDAHLNALRKRYISTGWKYVERDDKWVGSYEDGRTEKYLKFQS